MSNSYPTLFSRYQLGNLQLKNRIVMAPMTRSRATGNLPNALMARYYAQRATAGLIITEGISPSPDGLGYARIPGIYSEAQTEAWKAVTDAVHREGGRIFAQLMHTGRITHPLNLPAGARVAGASAIAAASSSLWTDQEKLQPVPVPEAVTDIPALIAEYVHAARSAVAAGFDGIELHAANGYLPMQFLNVASNQREDEYGGTPENRNRFVVELSAALAGAIGREKVGIRLSPLNPYNDMAFDDSNEGQYIALARELGNIGLVYAHLLDTGLPPAILEAFRAAFDTMILNVGYTAERAEADLASGKAELISFGSSFIANPDLVHRMQTGAPLAAADERTFYSAGEQGYTDYPALGQ